MTTHSEIPKWAPKVAQAKIRRLYIADAEGMIDEDLIKEVGWALWSRCDSILTVTAAHHGRVICPICGEFITHPSRSAETGGEKDCPWQDEDVLQCGNCAWQVTWRTYHQTYRGKQLFGANAVAFFEGYHRAFPQASASNTKMVLIDQLIHAFHTGLNEPGRPVGANLIEGTLEEVIRFLDGLTNGPKSAAGISRSRDVWRSNLASISWARSFLNLDEHKGTESSDGLDR